MIDLKIYNINGEIVFQTNLNATNKELNLAFLKTGVYGVVIKTNSGRIVKRIIKE